MSHLIEPPTEPVEETAAAPLYSQREEHRLEAIQRMVDRLEHRMADPTYRKSHWMMAELSALKWVMRILRSNPDESLGATVTAVRMRERRLDTRGDQ